MTNGTLEGSVCDILSRPSCLQLTGVLALDWPPRGSTESTGCVWDPTLGAPHAQMCLVLVAQQRHSPGAWLAALPPSHPRGRNPGTVRRGHAGPPGGTTGCFQTAFGWTHPCWCRLWDSVIPEKDGDKSTRSNRFIVQQRERAGRFSEQVQSYLLPCV